MFGVTNNWWTVRLGLVAVLFLAGCTGQSDSSSPAPSLQSSDAAPTTSDGGPVGIPECGAYWGAYVNSGLRAGGRSANEKLAAITTVEDDIDRRFDIDHQFYRWDNFLTDFNVENYVQVTIDDGRIPFLSWKPVYADGTNIAWSSIADGEHDDLIREKAATVASLQQPVLLVFGHEANGRVGPFEPGVAPPGHIRTKAGSEQDFVDAWQHVHDVFAGEGATNVSWVWVMARAPFEGEAEQADALFPGDDYVDWIGVDPYNFYHDQQQWVEMETLMASFTDWVDTRSREQPWLLGEWGTVEDPAQEGRKAEWLANAADYFEAESRLKAIVHFDSSPGFDWVYDSSPSARDGFRAISNRPHFEQKC